MIFDSSSFCEVFVSTSFCEVSASTSFYEVSVNGTSFCKVSASTISVRCLSAPASVTSVFTPVFSVTSLRHQFLQTSDIGNDLPFVRAPSLYIHHYRTCLLLWPRTPNLT